jgi:hypothetical protein
MHTLISRKGIIEGTERSLKNHVSRELDHSLDQLRLICPKYGERGTGGRPSLPRRRTMANQQGIKADISLSGFDN